MGYTLILQRIRLLIPAENDVRQAVDKILSPTIRVRQSYRNAGIEVWAVELGK